MALETLTTLLIIFLLYVAVTLLPLYFAVKVLGGEATLLRVFLVQLLSALITGVISGLFGAILAAILGALTTYVLYKVFFRIGFIRVFLAVLLSGALLAVIVFILGLFGLSAALVKGII